MSNLIQKYRVIFRDSDNNTIEVVDQVSSLNEAQSIADSKMLGQYQGQAVTYEIYPFRFVFTEFPQLFLDETDWMVIRHMETGKQCPPEILAKRQEARDAIL